MKYLLLSMCLLVSSCELFPDTVKVHGTVLDIGGCAQSGACKVKLDTGVVCLTRYPLIGEKASCWITLDEVERARIENLDQGRFK